MVGESRSNIALHFKTNFADGKVVLNYKNAVWGPEIHGDNIWHTTDQREYRIKIIYFEEFDKLIADIINS